MTNKNIANEASKLLDNSVYDLFESEKDEARVIFSQIELDVDALKAESPAKFNKALDMMLTTYAFMHPENRGYAVKYNNYGKMAEYMKAVFLKAYGGCSSHQVIMPDYVSKMYNLAESREELEKIMGKFIPQMNEFAHHINN